MPVIIDGTNGVNASAVTTTSWNPTNLVIPGNSTIGDASTDTLTVNATSTFVNPVIISGQSASTANYPSLLLKAFTAAQSAHPVIQSFRAGGTEASPTASSGSLLRLMMYGHNGSQFIEGAQIFAYQESAWSVGSTPAAMQFFTNDGTGSTAKLTITGAGHIITGAGNVGVGTSGTLSKKLEVNGTLLAGGNSSYSYQSESNVTYNSILRGTTQNGVNNVLYISVPNSNQANASGASNSSILGFSGTFPLGDNPNSYQFAQIKVDATAQDWAYTRMTLGTMNSGTLRNNLVLHGDNVGIGTNTPGVKLDVAGTIRSTGPGIFYTQGSSNYTSLATNAFVIGAAAKNVSSSGGQGTLTIMSNDPAASSMQGSISLVTDATAANRRLVIGCIEQGTAWRNVTLAETAGYVGLGISVPSAKLHIGVNGSLINTPQSYTVSLGEGLMINCYDTGSGGYGGQRFTDIASIGAQVTGYGGSAIRFITNPQGSNTGVTRLMLQHDGNVGIGTEYPTAKLHVVSATSGVVASLLGPNAYSAESGIEVSQGRAKISGFLEATGGVPGAFITLNTMPSGGSITERVRIQSDGNVGINTTDASLAKLSVYAPSGRAEYMGGGANGQGGANWMRVVKFVNYNSSNNKLIIPFVYQGSLNSTTICRVMGHTAEYNVSSNVKGFEVTFAVGHLVALYALTAWGGGGTYSSIAINGMNVEITLSTTYNGRTEGGVTAGGMYIMLEYMTNVPAYSINVAGIALN